MYYYSTNGETKPVSFREAVMKGLPDDNGLFMPENIPVFNKEKISHLLKAPLDEVGYEIADKFVDGEIPDGLLKDLIANAINFKAPVITLKDNLHILELFHGPTLAFKDFGGRFMARIMGFFNRNENTNLEILVATSGDTGGAVASGFFEVPGIRVTILFPKGKVSPLQEKQLTTWGKNIYAIEVDGTFDDCQRLVKTAFLDYDLKKNHRFTSANSINISRLIPQSFYYFHAAGQVPSPPIFSVPSGNFGNLCGGLIAWKMGLPVEKFVAAVNKNDVFPDYLQTKKYTPRPSEQTLSNAMDVGHPSNFPRVLEIFNKNHDDIRQMIWSISIDDSKTVGELTDTFEQYGYLCDPHTAVATAGLKKHNLLFNTKTPGIALSTAHPAKFVEVVERVLNNKIEIPETLKSLENKETQKVEMSSDFKGFKEFLMFR